jgi:aromatic-L-amino-acid/L-tryptophan decarboxylase
MTERAAAVNMNSEEFRKAGYFLIDRIADFLDRIDKGPVATAESPTQLQDILGNAPLPEHGISAEAILKRATDLLFNHSLFNGHPKFLGYITSSPAPIGALADLLAAAVNPNVGANILSPMATEIEKQTIQWLSEFIGLPHGYGGIMVSGGNMANFTAFVAARSKAERTLSDRGISPDKTRFIAYCSKATHTWIEKAATFFGIGKHGVRWIEHDDQGRIRVDLLTKSIQEDLTTRYTPFLVIGNAGDVSTGVVDDLSGLASVCKNFNLWFHIDGAYGIPAAVIPELKTLFSGIEEADSIALDPHKWLYSPLEAGCTLVKDPNTLLHAYSTHPVYYNFDSQSAPRHNYYEYGFQNSRGFRALKVWAALQQVGRQGYVKMIGEDIALSKLLFRLANDHPELEAVTQNLSICTLRYVPTEWRDQEEKHKHHLNNLNETLLNVLQQKGEVFLSNAVVDGRYCLRGCIVNFRTSKQDIEEIAEIIVREGRSIYAASSGKSEK